jgi:hypothetical protein
MIRGTLMSHTIPDCGSNSCFYSHGGGMRTNGPCECHLCPTCGAHVVHHKHYAWCTTPEWKTPLMRLCEQMRCSVPAPFLHSIALRKRAVLELILLWAEDPETEGPETLKALETCLAELLRIYPTTCESP